MIGLKPWIRYILMTVHFSERQRLKLLSAKLLIQSNILCRWLQPTDIEIKKENRPRDVKEKSKNFISDGIELSMKRIIKKY